MTMDVFPTFLSLAGVEVPPTLRIDGVDLSPVLFGEGAPPERTVFWSYRGLNMPRHEVARRGAWKLLVAGPRKRLFNLGRDPAEKKDVAAEHPEIRDDLFAQFEIWDTEMASIPTRTQNKVRVRPKE
jgi:arylsulfatase A-like enzyme